MRMGGKSVWGRMTDVEKFFSIESDGVGWRFKHVQTLSDLRPPQIHTQTSGAKLSPACINDQLQRDATPVDIMMRAITTL